VVEGTVIRAGLGLETAIRLQTPPSLQGIVYVQETDNFLALIQDACADPGRTGTSRCRMAKVSRNLAAVRMDAKGNVLNSPIDDMAGYVLTF
jgi:hypothetical protein